MSAAQTLHPASAAAVRPRSLRSQFKWTFVGNSVNFGAQWAMVAMLTKAGTKELVGHFTLGLAIAAPIIAVATLQLQQMLATDARGEFSFSDYFGTRILCSLLGLLTIVGVALAGEEPASTTWIIVWVGVWKSADLVSEIIRANFQRFERMDLAGLSLIIKGLAALVALIVTFWLSDKNLALASAALALCWIASILLFDVPVSVRLMRQIQRLGPADIALWPRFDLSTIGRITVRAAPLGVGLFLLTLRDNIPRYFIKADSGDVYVGYYSAMSYLPAIGMMVVAALAQSAAPRLSQHYAFDRPRFRKLLTRLLFFGLGIGTVFVVGALAGGPLALRLAYNAEYVNFETEFVWITVYSAISTVLYFVGVGLVAARLFRYQLISGVAAALITPIVAWIGFRLWPHTMWGAIVSNLAASVVMLLIYAQGLYRTYREEPGVLDRARGERGARGAGSAQIDFMRCEPLGMDHR